MNRAYFCTNCGIEYAKWQGKCDACHTWNLISPITIVSKTKNNKETNADALALHIAVPKKLEEITIASDIRISCVDEELNRVLGGGIVPGSLVLLGGEPGIGKSTLLLQMALQLKQIKVLYVSGEETENQIKIRSIRLGLSSPNCFLLQENSLKQIIHHAHHLQPTLLIIDSIQTLYHSEEEGSIGSINQIRTCATRLLQYAKNHGIAVFLIGHMNKEGTLAGPKLLEHMVDTVLQFEGDKQFLYRMVRTLKNRFGNGSELGIYEMKEKGLYAVKNPSTLLISTKDNDSTGIAAGSCLAGTRPLILEIQALVTPTRYGHSQRNTTGYEPKRLVMLLAVLEKRVGLRLYDRDVFLNLTGGIKAEDPALDVAVCMAIASSLKDRSIPNNRCFIAEVALGGQLHAVPRIDQRVAEAAKLGYKEVFISDQNCSFPPSIPIKIHPVKDLKELIQQI